MKDLIAVAAAAVAFLITYTPTDLAKKLEPWKLPITLAILALVGWLLVRFGIYWAGRRDARAAKVSPFVLVAKTVHDDLLSWHKIDAKQVDQRMLIGAEMRSITFGMARHMALRGIGEALD